MRYTEKTGKSSSDTSSTIGINYTGLGVPQNRPRKENNMKLYGDEYAPDDVYVVPWCYLHGKLERDVGYDIFCSEESDRLPDGISHHTIIMPDGSEQKCIAYIWSVPEKDLSGTWMKPRGFVLYEDDTEHIESILEDYNNKSEFI